MLSAFLTGLARDVKTTEKPSQAKLGRGPGSGGSRLPQLSSGIETFLLP
jgi:hypothetical protein